MKHQGMRYLSEEEIELKYTEVAAFVRTLSDGLNHDVKLAPRNECDIGREALICPILGHLDLYFSKVGAALRKRFPGSDFHFEVLPSGCRAEFVLNLWVKNEYANHSNTGGGFWSSRSDKSGSGNSSDKPSTEWGMFLGKQHVCCICMLTITTSYGKRHCRRIPVVPLQRWH